MAPCHLRFPGVASGSTVTLSIAGKELELAFWLPDPPYDSRHSDRGPVPASRFIAGRGSPKAWRPCHSQLFGAASSSAVTLLIVGKELKLAFWLPGTTSGSRHSNGTGASFAVHPAEMGVRRRGALPSPVPRRRFQFNGDAPDSQEGARARLLAPRPGVGHLRDALAAPGRYLSSLGQRHRLRVLTGASAETCSRRWRR